MTSNEVSLAEYADPKKRACRMVARIVGPEWIDAWWNSHNNAFGMTPDEMWVHDQERVFAYLETSTEGYW